MSDGWSRLVEPLGDWLSYRPSDFLMFAPRTYWRLFELHNEAWWPMPLLGPLAGVVGLAVLTSRSRGGALVAARRLVAAGLAALATFVGGAFVFDRYGAVNWAAQGLAAGWAVLAVLLLMLAVSRGPAQPASQPAAFARRTAFALGLWALLLHPLLAPLVGRPLMQAEVFALAPDPTAIAVLAWLLARPAEAAGWLRWTWHAAWVLALTLCAASAATLALLDEWQALVPLLAAVSAVAALRVASRPA